MFSKTPIKGVYLRRAKPGSTHFDIHVDQSVHVRLSMILADRTTHCPHSILLRLLQKIFTLTIYSLQQNISLPNKGKIIYSFQENNIVLIIQEQKEYFQ